MASIFKVFMLFSALWCLLAVVETATAMPDTTTLEPSTTTERGFLRTIVEFLFNFNRSPPSDDNAETQAYLTKLGEDVVSSLRPNEYEPCDDFYNYVCAGWKDNREILANETVAAALYDLVVQAAKNQRALLEDDTPASLKEIDLARMAYRSCMNVDHLNELGVAPFIEWLDRIGFKWPVLQGNSWSDLDFDWQDAEITMRSQGFVTLLVGPVGIDVRDSDKLVISIDQAQMSLPRSMLVRALNDTVLQTYRQMMIDLTTRYGADRQLAESDMESVLHLQRSIAEITRKEEDRRDFKRMLNSFSLKLLGERWPQIRWAEYFRRVMPADVQLDDDEEILVYEMDYITQLIELLERTPKRTVANLYGWQRALAVASTLDLQTGEIVQRFDRTIDGTEENAQRWALCLSAAGPFRLALDRLYVQRHFAGQSRQGALTMIEEVSAEFQALLEGADWMADEDKAVAKEKLARIEARVGYPDYTFNDTFLHDKLKGLVMYDGRLFQSAMENVKTENDKQLSLLRKPVDKSIWFTGPSTVNAFYHPLFNQIVFPAAFLQPPLYSARAPAEFNYGGVGFVMGHEITHGFDSVGRLFDPDGNVRTWWSASTTTNYVERAECFVGQYANWTHPQVQRAINGRLTLGENIADNGGVRAAFNAYKRHLRTTPSALLSSVPGLEHYTPEQQFFLAFGYSWCTEMRDEVLHFNMENARHSPAMARVIWPLANFEEFAEAWNCPRGSVMNPEKRCRLW